VGIMISNNSKAEGDQMTCDQYDGDAGLCKLLDFKFYEGMDRPCEYVKDPAVCPVANMKG